jgi:hypothetical protein
LGPFLFCVELTRGWPGGSVERVLRTTVDDAESLRVRAEWDDNAMTWIATSEDIAGLTAAAPSLDQLLDRLRAIVEQFNTVRKNRFGPHSERPIILVTRI